MDEQFTAQVLEDIKRLAVQVGRLQQARLGDTQLKIEKKSTGIDLVTEVDKLSEQMILAFLKERYPDHSVLSEESGLADKSSEYLWIVDPLDGTTNYAQGLPIFAISIALQYRGRTMLGVVYAPVVEQLFSATRGGGAFLNGQRLRVAQKESLRECVLATGFPYDIAEHPVNNLCYFSKFSMKCRAIRRLGAAAYDLACVAAGKFDGFWELNLSPWDVAAGMLLVEEAGGTITHFRADRRISIVAANAAINRQICETIAGIDGHAIG